MCAALLTPRKDAPQHYFGYLHVTERRLKYVLVFSGFTELKLCVGSSFFTAKALFIGEYQLPPGWDLGIVLALHASCNSWLLQQAQALCQRSDVVPRPLTCPRWICIRVVFSLGNWNDGMGFVLHKRSFVSVIFKHCIQILSLFSVEVRKRLLEQTTKVKVPCFCLLMKPQHWCFCLTSQTLIHGWVTAVTQEKSSSVKFPALLQPWVSRGLFRFSPACPPWYVHLQPDGQKMQHGEREGM